MAKGTVVMRRIASLVIVSCAEIRGKSALVSGLERMERETYRLVCRWLPGASSRKSRRFIMPGQLDGKRILILATNGFEQSELEQPRDALKAAGAQVHIASPEQGEIKGWDKKDWGRAVKVDKALSAVKAADYDAIVLPGGQINPDVLRIDKDALALIRSFFDAGKTVAAICHAPWLLIETGIAKGRKMTGYTSIKTDLVNAGAIWEDSAVVTDNGVITSRNPSDLDAFSNKIIEEVREGRHQRRAA
jgi:protease I